MSIGGPHEVLPSHDCGVCRWALECRAQWRADDDLSLVANLTSRQRRALHTIEVTTRTGLAEPPHPLPERLDDAGREALARIRAQAGIQVRGEREGRVLSQRIPVAPDREGELVPNSGLLMLPEPSHGDLFFDIEGDPFFGSDEVDGMAASNLRAHSESEVGAPVVTGGPHAAAISESSERQRAAKSRRCSARGIESPRPRRQRKYCRNSSNAEQKRAADAKLPKPRIG